MEGNEGRLSRGEKLLLRASGTDLAIISRMPASELKWYKRLGAGVFITTVMALISSFVAFRTVFNSVLAFPFALGLAGLYATAIYIIDSFLVSLNIRPYRFPRAGQNSDSDSYRNSGRVAAVMAALPRMALSLIVGVLIAEPLLLLMFRTEVDERVALIQDQLSVAQENSVREKYERNLNALSTQSKEAARIDEIDARVLELNKQADEAETSADRSKDLADAEEKGDEIVAPDGSKVTTGFETCGPECRGHLRDEADSDAKARNARAEIARLETEREQLVEEVGTSEADRIADIQRLEKERQSEINSKRAEAGEANGLLIQIDALHQLATDETPYDTNDGQTQAPEATPSSRPSATSAESAAPVAASPSGGPKTTSVLGLTTMGWAMWTVRLWLILLDMIAVIMKLFLSLRARRPYDSAVAVSEEASLGSDAVDRATDEATVDLLRASAREASASALDDSGGVWIDTSQGRVFLGPNGSLEIRSKGVNKLREAGLLNIAKNERGEWQLERRPR